MLDDDHRNRTIVEEAYFLPGLKEVKNQKMHGMVSRKDLPAVWEKADPQK